MTNPASKSLKRHMANSLNFSGKRQVPCLPTGICFALDRPHALIAFTSRKYNSERDLDRLEDFEAVLLLYENPAVVRESDGLSFGSGVQVGEQMSYIGLLKVRPRPCTFLR